MKKFNKKDLIIFFVILIVGILSVIFVYNDDFLYKKQIMKITSIKTIKEDSSTNTLGLNEKYYTKEIVGINTNLKNKGKKITVKYEETYSSVVTEKYRIGDKVFVGSNTIDNLKRDNYVVIMIFSFVLSIYLVGKLRGLLAILSVTLNTFVFYYGLEFYFNGMNLLLLCMLESIIFTIFSLLIAGGKNKKTFSAIISTFVSTLILLIMTLLVVSITKYSGISFNGMSYLTVPVEDVFIAELMLGGLGAIMDVSITMSSSIAELVEKDNSIKRKSLVNSGREIGKDIMGTMINVLFFTYLCSGLPIFVLALRNGFTLTNYVTTNFTLETTRFLVGSIGIVLAIPIALFISIKLLKRGEVNE